MLKTTIIQAATTGFLFHWLITDSAYWQANPKIWTTCFVLFVVNLAATCWAYIFIERNNKILEKI